MSNIIIRKIVPKHKSDALIPNEPFQLWGRMIPRLENGKWSYSIVLFDEITEMRFPDEPYDVEKDDAIFLGAYEGDTCIGLAVLRRKMFRYLYLDDLKVNAAYRKKGVGGKLINACMAKAERLGLQGVYTINREVNYELFRTCKGKIFGKKIQRKAD